MPDTGWKVFRHHLQKITIIPSNFTLTELKLSTCEKHEMHGTVREKKSYFTWHAVVISLFQPSVFLKVN